MESEQRVKQLNRVSYNTIIVNAGLGLAVLFAELVGRSTAVLSDSINTLSDVLFSIGVLIGVTMGGKKRDADHNYGHEQYESVAGILLSGMLVVVAVGIGWSGVKNISLALRGELVPPGWLAIGAAFASILIKEGLFQYASRVAKRFSSPALMADAWHHRSDVLSSLGALVGVGGAMLGFPILDPIASIVIGILIIKMAVDIFRDSVNQMTDKAADPEVTKQVREMILRTPGVERLDILMTRVHGNVLFIDAEIAVRGSMSVREGHHIATVVHNRVEDTIQQVKHVTVHVNPAEDEPLFDEDISLEPEDLELEEKS